MKCVGFLEFFTSQQGPVAAVDLLTGFLPATHTTPVSAPDHFKLQHQLHAPSPAQCQFWGQLCAPSPTEWQQHPPSPIWHQRYPPNPVCCQLQMQRLVELQHLMAQGLVLHYEVCSTPVPAPCQRSARPRFQEPARRLAGSRFLVPARKVARPRFQLNVQRSTWPWWVVRPRILSAAQRVAWLPFLFPVMKTSRHLALCRSSDSDSCSQLWRPPRSCFCPLLFGPPDACPGSLSWCQWGTDPCYLPCDPSDACNCPSFLGPSDSWSWFLGKGSTSANHQTAGWSFRLHSPWTFWRSFYFHWPRVEFPFLLAFDS